MLIVYVAGKDWESLSPCIIIHSPFNKKDNSGMLKINQMWKSAKITLVYPCNFDDLNACNCSITAWLLATQIGWIRSLSLKLHRQSCPIMTKGIYGGPLQVVLLFDFPLRSDSMGSSKQLSKEENIAQYHGSEDSYKKLSRRFKLSVSTKPSSGRPWKTQERHRQRIVRMITPKDLEAQFAQRTSVWQIDE